MAPDHARQDRARIAQLADDAVNHHQHQDEHHLGPQEQLQEPFPRRSSGFPSPSAPAVCRVLPPHFTPVELLQQVGQVLGNQVNDLQFQRLVGGDGRRFRPPRTSAHSTLRWRFSAMVSMKLAVAVLHLLLHHLVGSSRGRRPPIATGCAAPMLVCGAMAAMSAARVMKAPRAAGARAGGSDIDHGRHLARRRSSGRSPWWIRAGRPGCRAG